MDIQPTDHHADRGSGRRRRALGLLREFAPALGVLLIGALVLIFDGNELSWLIGVIAGGSAGAWLVLRRDDPRSLGRSRAPMRAEHRTASALEPLQGAGWRFRHDVRGIDTTYDHIAIGPGGVIVLQSISADGVVTMRGGEPVLEQRSSPDAAPRLQRLRPRAVTDAAAFRGDVERLSGRRLWVQAVVVLWSDFPAGCVVDGHCVFIHGSRLAGWLARRPHQLDPAETDHVAAAVELVVQCGGEFPLPAASPAARSRLSA
ncbi:MAG: nuclease-related domain-containing protein [Solirubrobacteraceae bacterium]